MRQAVPVLGVDVTGGSARRQYGKSFVDNALSDNSIVFLKRTIGNRRLTIDIVRILLPARPIPACCIPLPIIAVQILMIYVQEL